MSTELTRPGQVLYILSVLRHQGLLTVREKNLLKGMLLRKDERLFRVTARTRDATVFHEVAATLRALAQEEAQQRYSLLMDVFKSDEARFLKKAKEARAARRGEGEEPDMCLVNGEIEFESFVNVIGQLRIPPSAKFVDLGSGSGKAVLAASLLFDFESLHGVELLESLYEASQSVLGTFRKLEGDMHELPEDAVPITFHNADFLDFDWSWGDVVFANSTCFTDELMAQISKRVALLKPGSLVVTVTQPLKSPWVRLVKKSTHEMSWGAGTYFIHQRTSASPSAPRPDLHIAVARSSAAASESLKFASSPQGNALLEAKR